MSTEIHKEPGGVLTAGLTGSIATGKSTVAGMFRRLGDAVIDADAVGHEILRLPSVRDAIQEKYGSAVLDDSGEIIRPRLGEIIFADAASRAWLNNLTHPPIRREIRRRIRHLSKENPGRLIIIEVPLLLESGKPRRYGPVILAWCPEEMQLDRLMRRDNLTRADAERRVRAQLSIDKKRSLADYIIDTSVTLAETQDQVAEVRQHLLARPA
jgi:dephospho-CoA kinase